MSSPRLSDLLDASLTGKHGALSDVFVEEPVDLTTFVQDAKFLANPPLSKVQYDAVRHVEQIFFPETYDAMVKEFGRYWKPKRMINFATLQWGKGAGKDHVCRMMSLRVAYLLLCLRSPQDYYSMPRQDTIHLLNVASSANQAQQAFFIPLTRAVKRNWFADRCEPRQNVVSWDKNIESISGHSDAESQEGLNLLLAIADEIDAFRTQDEIERFRGKGMREPVKSAESILKMMRTSASTRFPSVYKNVMISYPRFVGSTIQKLTNKARKDLEEKGEQSRHYVSGPLCTWDVNPRVRGRKDFEEDYAENERMAMSMYECKPSNVVDPYFKNRHVWESALVEVKRQPIEISYEFDFERQTWEPEFDFDPAFKPIEGSRYAIHGDIAITGDRAGVAMAHVADWQEGSYEIVDFEGGTYQVPTVLPNITVDFVTSFGADSQAKPEAREIQIRWYRQLVWKLKALGFPILMVTFDGFQSVDTIQTLALSGVETDVQSMDRTIEPWRTLKDVVYEERLKMPMWTPLLERELNSLYLTAQGKIDHPTGGSKDEADALCGAVMGALRLGGREDEQQTVAYAAEIDFSDGLASVTSNDLPVGFDLWSFENHTWERPF